MRLGDYPVTVRKNTLAMHLYGRAEIVERHRHRYEVNPLYIPELEKAGAGILRVLEEPHGDL